MLFCWLQIFFIINSFKIFQDHHHPYRATVVSSINHSDLRFLKSSLTRVFPLCYSGKQFVGSSTYNQYMYYIENRTRKVFIWEIYNIFRSFYMFLAHLSRRLIGELIVYQWLRHPSSVNIFKHLLLGNYGANWTQISYGDSLGWGNKSLFKWSWSHDQDGRHAHIW